MGARNPFAFRPGPVTFWTTVVYLLLAVPLIWVHETVPPAPADPNAVRGLNLTQGWLDLSEITRQYHPYNSRNNDGVRDYLLRRIATTLDGSGVSWRTEGMGVGVRDAGSRSSSATPVRRDATGPEVVVFNDLLSNVTIATKIGSIGSNIGTQRCGMGTYFEGTNIVVYIRGTEDEPGDWWKTASPQSPSSAGADKQPPYGGKGGVLVNAHYDSVSTGYGATDDGMGCVTVLHLIEYFTARGRQPKHGIVALLNNGEEDFLWGARAFAYHPMMPFCHTFLNLEGAGAGGRAVLFRSTDREVTEAYAASPHPFGNVIASDGFSMGLIRSQTDYVVFHDVYGARGLDVAFYRPRARYHTNQDDARHASRRSLWHMLSASVATVERLTAESFDGPRPGWDNSPTKVASGEGHDGVWFDLFGKAFAIFALRGLFAWSLTLLVATPLILMLVSYILVRVDKYYFFTGSIKVHEDLEDDPISIGGWKGFFRFPIAITVAGALTLGSAFLVRKFNPFIIYSSEYAVWTMMLSLFYTSFWTMMRGAAAVRPSALQRGYVHIWLFILCWAVLVPLAVFEDRFRLAFGYPFVILMSAIFVSTFVSLCDLFALPKRREVAQTIHDEHQIRDHLDEVPNSDALIAPSPGEMENAASAQSASGENGGAAAEAADQEEDESEEEVEPSETTPLRAAKDIKSRGARTTFATTYRRSVPAAATDGPSDEDADRGSPFEHEQAWSTKLPSWTWFLQLLLLAPITLIIFGQVALFLSAALSGTGVDGGNQLMPYLLLALLSILLLVPIMPFIHRVTWQIPVFLLAVFAATLAYNLLAFPFSAENRYKAFFQQSVNLDTGATTVKIMGKEEFLRSIVAELPSASGRELQCKDLSESRPGLQQCEYDGSAVPPNVVGVTPGVPPETGYASWVTFNITRPDPELNVATIEIDARETKACFLNFTRPLVRFAVRDGNEADPRFGEYPDAGVCQLKLWRRDWAKKWTVEIEWKGDAAAAPPGADVNDGISDDAVELRMRTHPADDVASAPGLKPGTAAGIDGKVTCIWSDANTAGAIPALDELLQYAPTWVAITKAAEGLVEGSKSFMI